MIKLHHSQDEAEDETQDVPQAATLNYHSKTLKHVIDCDDELLVKLRGNKIIDQPQFEELMQIEGNNWKRNHMLLNAIKKLFKNNAAFAWAQFLDSLRDDEQAHIANLLSGSGEPGMSADYQLNLLFLF